VVYFFKLVTGTKSLMNPAICSGKTFLDLSQLLLVNSWILHSVWQDHLYPEPLDLLMIFIFLRLDAA